jgi:heptosyltransferase-2
MMPDYRNILIVRTDRIGDIILTTPAIEAMRTNFPNAKITVLVSRVTRDLVDGNPYLDEVLIDDRQGRFKGALGFWQLVAQIRSRKFDVAFIFHTKKRTNLLCFLAGIPVRVGYTDKHYGFLLTRGFEDRRHFGEQHEVEYCLDILRKMGLKVASPSIFVPVDPKAEKWAQEWLTKNNPSGLKIVAIHPAASDSTKRWPAGCFIGLVDQLIDRHKCLVIVIGTGAAVDLARELRAQCSRTFIDLTGQTSVAQIVSLLRRCQLVISNDSGPMHLGAAAGIYVIALFLRNQPGINPERWRPFTPKGFVLSNRPEEAIRLGSNGNVASGQMDSIKVEDVVALAEDLLKRH